MSISSQQDNMYAGVRRSVTLGMSKIDRDRVALIASSLPMEANMKSIVVRVASLTAFCIATGGLLPNSAVARRDPFEGWHRPVVISVEVDVMREDDDRRRRHRERDEIRLEPDQSATVFVEGRDQDDDRFDRDRMIFGLDLNRCDRLLRVRDRGTGEFEFTADDDAHGECTATLFVPGNANLDFDLRFEIGRKNQADGSRGNWIQGGEPTAQHTYLAGCLYKAILGRSADSKGLDLAAREIARGNLKKQMTAMFSSPEFRGRSSSRDAETMLDQFYRGMLDRDPDSRGKNTYLPIVRKGAYGEVLNRLMNSPEFQKKMQRATEH